MKSIATKGFAESCMAALKGASAEGVVVMKDGRPVARLTPIISEKGMPTAGDVFRADHARAGSKPKGIGHLHGILKGKIRIKGNIFSTGVKWDAESGHEYPALQPKRHPTAKGTATSKRK